MGLKSFFAKLLGKTDDVAKLAATYGDDVVEGVAKYGDDVSGLVADNAGRALMSPELISDDFLDAIDDYANHTPHYDSSVDDEVYDMFARWADEPAPDPDLVDLGTGKLFHYGSYDTPNGSLKNDLINKRRAMIDPDYPRPARFYSVPSEVPQEFGQLITFDDRANFPKQTNFLGDVSAQAQPTPESPFTLSLKQPIDTEQLVLQSPQQETGYGTFGLRPHNNTALGKWFRKQMPYYGIELDIDSFKF